MSLKTGTYSMADLLDNRFQSPVAFGEDTLAEVLNADLANHNQIMVQQVSELCEVTTDVQRIGGSSVNGEMIEADEISRGPTQRDIAGQTVGFPLRRFQFAIGWTRDFLRTKTVADMAQAQVAAERAHIRRVIYMIKNAIFVPTNFSFVDFLARVQITLGVKALTNADGALIPDGPNAETFNGATHTHYLASATLTTAAVDSLIQTVVEHGYGQNVMIYINRGDEALWKALSGFQPFFDPTITKADTVDEGNQTLDISRLDNRAIGRYNGATVWTKPWMPQSYAFCFAAGSPLKPLCLRQREDTVLQGLRIAGELDNYPLQAQFMQFEGGVGAWNRSNGAVLQYNNGTYSAPTIVL